MTEFGEAMEKFLDNRVGTFGITEEGHFRCGNKVYEDAKTYSRDDKDLMFTRRRRQALVPCGDHTVSVIWGSNAYCENRGVEGEAFNEAPMSAEVAVWKNGDPQTFVRLPANDGCDDVLGYQTVFAVNTIINYVRTVLDTPLV